MQPRRLSPNLTVADPSRTPTTRSLQRIYNQSIRCGSTTAARSDLSSTRFATLDSSVNRGCRGRLALRELHRWGGVIACAGIVACGASASRSYPTGMAGQSEAGQRNGAGGANSDAAHSGSGGAAGGSTEPERNSICDGSASLRLRVFVEPQPALELRGSIVSVENGSPSSAVDGMCRYFIGGWLEEKTSRDEGWRVGQVDDALKTELDASMGMEDLSTLTDCVPVAGLSDSSTLTIRNPRSTSRCRGMPGPRFSAAWQAVADRATDLWNRAKPLDQGLHVAAAETPAGPPDPTPAYPFPVGYSLDSIMLDPQEAAFNTPGTSKPISPADAPRFRALRDQYIADVAASPGLYSNWDGQKMTDGKRTAFVYMRDVLPYEGAQGLLPFSGPQ